MNEFFCIIIIFLSLKSEYMLESYLMLCVLFDGGKKTKIKLHILIYCHFIFTTQLVEYKVKDLNFMKKKKFINTWDPFISIDY